MEVNFSNLEQYEISFSELCEHSKFDLEDFKGIPEIHLNQIKPLSPKAIKFTSELIKSMLSSIVSLNIGLVGDFLFIEPGLCGYSK